MTSQFFLRYAKPLDDLLAAVKEGSVVVDLVLYIDVEIVGVVGFLFVIDKPAQAVSHDVTHRYWTYTERAHIQTSTYHFTLTTRFKVNATW